MRPCPHCGGKGYSGFTDDTQTTTIPDPYCQGTGQVPDDYQASEEAPAPVEGAAELPPEGTPETPAPEPAGASEPAPEPPYPQAEPAPEPEAS